MGQAYEIGRFMGQFALVMIAVLLGIPLIIGICAKSWLWGFSSLLAECIIIFVACNLSKDARDTTLRRYFHRFYKKSSSSK